MSVSTSNISFYNGEVKYTNVIELLGLGTCTGEVISPPTIFSKTFKPTSYFSKSPKFSESNEFTETDDSIENINCIKHHYFLNSFTELLIVVDHDADLQGDGKDKGLSTGAIVGISVAAVADVAIAKLKIKKNIYLLLCNCSKFKKISFCFILF